MDRIGYPIKDRDPNAPTGSTARVVLVVLAVLLVIGGLIVAWFTAELNEGLRTGH